MMSATRLDIDAKDRSVSRPAAAGGQRAGPSPERNEGKRQARTQYCCEERHESNPRVRDGDDDNGRDHAEPADALNPDVGHVDQRR
jgi:hypothetical protein